MDNVTCGEGWSTANDYRLEKADTLCGFNEQIFRSVYLIGAVLWCTLTIRTTPPIIAFARAKKKTASKMIYIQVPVCAIGVISGINYAIKGSLMIKQQDRVSGQLFWSVLSYPLSHGWIIWSCVYVIVSPFYTAAEMNLTKAKARGASFRLRCMIVGGLLGLVNFVVHVFLMTDVSLPERFALNHAWFASTSVTCLCVSCVLATSGWGLTNIIKAVLVSSFKSSSTEAMETASRKKKDAAGMQQLFLRLRFVLISVLGVLQTCLLLSLLPVIIPFLRQRTWITMPILEINFIFALHFALFIVKGKTGSSMKMSSSKRATSKSSVQPSSQQSSVGVSSGAASSVETTSMLSEASSTALSNA